MATIKTGAIPKSHTSRENKLKTEMKILTVQQVSSMDSLALTSIIDFWKYNEPKSVLLAYAELKKRNYAISERLSRRQNEFCAKNNYENIDIFLNAYLKENGHNSYEEICDKELTLSENTAAINISDKSDQNSNSYDKYPALRTISSVYKIFAWIVGIVTLIVATMFLNVGTIGIIFSLISIVVGGLIVLVVVAIGESIMVFIDIEHNTRQKVK